MELGGQFMMFPLSHSKSLSPSGGFFALVLMISTRSDLVSRKSFLKKLLGRDFLIQPNVSPYIFAESKIWTLFLVNLNPTWTFHDRTNRSCELKNFSHSKRNAQKVSLVLISKCPELFAGVGYYRGKIL